MKFVLLIALLLAGCSSSPEATASLLAPAQSKKLTATQAADHIGERAKVCGVVASANFATRTRRQPTFLNLDEPYPRHIFTAVIWGEHRAKFGEPEQELKGKTICVTGLIENYKSKPQIVLREASQLEVSK